MLFINFEMQSLFFQKQQIINKIFFEIFDIIHVQINNFFILIFINCNKVNLSSLAFIVVDFELNSISIEEFVDDRSFK